MGAVLESVEKVLTAVDACLQVGGRNGMVSHGVSEGKFAANVGCRPGLPSQRLNTLDGLNAAWNNSLT